MNREEEGRSAEPPGAKRGGRGGPPLGGCTLQGIKHLGLIRRYLVHPWCCVGRPIGKESACDPRARKIPWRRARQPTPVFLLGKSHGQRSLVGSSPWGRKESNVTEQLSTQCSVTITTIQLQNTFIALKENPIHLRQLLPALPQPSLARVLAMQSTPCLCGCPLCKLLIRGVKLQKHIEQGSPHMGPCRERSPLLQPCITGGRPGLTHFNDRGHFSPGDVTSGFKKRRTVAGLAAGEKLQLFSNELVQNDPHQFSPKIRPACLQRLFLCSPQTNSVLLTQNCSLL